MQHSKLQARVIIVGAGPVGMTLAMDLAWRGIDVIVAETRYPGEPPSVKCNHVSARTMEVFRRLGLVEKVRNAGLPADYPNDASYRTTSTGIEMARIPIPARNERYTAKGGPDTWWPTAEPPHRINQIYLEPVLFEHAAAQPNIRILNRTEIEDFVQDETGVVATARDLDSGETFTITGAYLVGCDGGRSTIRRKIGAQLSGTPVIQRVQSTYFRAPKLLSMMPGERAWMYLSLNPRRTGTLVAIDGKETWLLHNHLYDGEPDFDSIDRDWALRTILGVGPDFEYEVLSKEDWVGRRLVADKFRDRRAFIAGDAAHLWIPYAGYGMNAGIADAMDLSWMLAAVLNGWAPESLLDAYERERQPITEQVSQFAMDMALKNMRQRKSTPPEVEMEGPEGDAARARVGQEAYDLNVNQYCCGGLNFGYFYSQSPVIAYDDGQHPAYTMYDFTPSTVPGCRAPHVFLPDGRSLYDALGPDYSVLRFDQAVDVTGLVEAAAKRGVPLTVVDVPQDLAGDLYRHKLALVRPDQHIAWRGDTLPPDPMALIDLIRGASVTAIRKAA
ncbi:FAD-dependent oxidoreductase [Pseudorhodoplanes sinuspersici]|uniref:Monooxygenase n=1 Tax=Pseudorhodoplanes sinuspersici TaxID=1235591 RepID=A0A1W6ZVF2_9HYPH|nr:FAD-dependent oxidoreductase [Pseudorhodoplanes sinuspersici]ARQ00735.1 monooxygenase [Pseudorhodoplanes sinuspersici]RKE72344.1 2-polyprenyl-6-methoxyphenol hydroxylase-like FAD-dependent oxidoreductase [Pseudorhodoplanes sinuspersici]